MATRSSLRSALWLGIAIVFSVLILPSPAAAAVVPGNTAALVNAGQLVREGSSAVPIFGISATCTAPCADQLAAINVNFAGNGFNAGNAGDLLALDTNPARSGIALYRDVGTVDDAFDGGDVGVTATGATWVLNEAQLTYTEAVPSAVTGNYHWILILRTSRSATLAEGDQISATIQANGISFVPAGSQPAGAVTTNTLTVARTSVADLLAPQTYIGPSFVAGNARAVLAFKIVDGGIPTNRGIDDTIDRVVVQLIDTSNTFGPGKFLPPNVNPALSGMGMYRDTDGDGVWGFADTPLVLSSITLDCVPAVDVLDVCLFPNAESVPDTRSVGAGYFIVVRSGSAMASGDDFSFEIHQNNGMRVDGLHADDANRFALVGDTASSSLLGDDTPPCLFVGCGQRADPAWEDGTGSPYLFPVGHTMYFSGLLNDTGAPGTVVLFAQDDESGLGQATFSPEASLAASPASPRGLSGAGVSVEVRANYTFNRTSNDTGSPATVQVFDAVGNSASTALTYVLDNATPTITADPGWINLGASPNVHIDDNGVLWFSPWMATGTPVRIRVDLADLEAGLGNATASIETSLAAGPEYADPTSFGPGTFGYNNWRVDYGIDATSTDASRPVDLQVCDNVGNCIGMAFDYRMDVTGPSVTILAPANGAVLSGTVVVAASAADAGSGLVEPPEVAILGASPFVEMFWNGTAWVFPIQTGLFADGRYRIVVQAFDRVGNVGAGGVDVTIANGIPTAVIVSPAAMDLLGGTVRVWARTASGLQASLVELRVDSGAWITMTYDAGSNMYYLDWSTTTGVDGAHTLSVRATSGSAVGPISSVSVTVDNTVPSVSVVVPAANAWLTGTSTFRVAAADGSGVDFVAVRINSGGWIPAAYDGLTDSWLVQVDTAGLATGSHSVVATAEDVVGNAVTSGSVAFRVDNDGPTVSIVAPAAFAYLGGTMTVSASASDAGSGVTAAFAQLGPRAPVTLSLVGGAWTGSINTVGLADGAHTLNVWVEDGVGLTASASAPVTVDNTAPSVDFLSPAAGSLVARAVDVRVGASDAVGVASVTLTVGTTIVAMAVAGADVYGYALDTSAMSGSVTLTATATDRAGRSTQANLAIEADNTAPSIVLQAPDGDAGAIILSATVSDAGAGVATVVFLVDGVAHEGVSVGGGEYWVVIFTTQADNGDHVYEVVATDGLGNAARQFGVLSVNNPSDFLRDMSAISPFLILLVAIVGLALWLILGMRRGKKGAEVSEPPKPDDL